MRTEPIELSKLVRTCLDSIKDASNLAGFEVKGEVHFDIALSFIKNGEKAKVFVTEIGGKSKFAKIGQIKFSLGPQVVHPTINIVKFESSQGKPPENQLKKDMSKD